MQYTTGVPFTGAVSPDLRQRAQQALSAPSPMSFQGPHRDVYAGLAQNNATGFARDATSADIDTMKRTREMQMQMALRGLEQMSQAQDNSRQLSNQMFSNQTGFLNGLLAGLYR